MLRFILSHPMTRGMDLDSPETTALRADIIQKKKFLKQIYLEWYGELIDSLPKHSTAPVLEIGSGGGFLKTLLPEVISSEIFHSPLVDLISDAQQLPFQSNSLKGLVMVNVLHHIPQIQRFFQEADRCTQSGGVISMIEPWLTPWSKLVYKRLHHEPFDDVTRNWSFPPRGPLSGANGALPWIVFQRDRNQFENQFPQWHIQTIKPLMPFRYLVSGGVSMRSLTPDWSTGFWHRIENMFSPWMERLGMFAHILVRKD